MNRLAQAASPYLRQHAENPVDWWEWSVEAWAAARAADRLVFLSIGYSTCHWCHVMAHESFEDEGVAAALRADFVAVKLDREERPDIDQWAMDYVVAATGHGGWPLTLVLTPDGEPVFGGTYFPKHDGERGTGLLRILAELSRLWREDRAGIQAAGAEARRRLSQRHEELRDQARGKVPGAEVFAHALADLESRADLDRGGFGGGPKFPRPVLLRLLIRLAARADAGLLEVAPNAAERARALLRNQFTAMARGGLRDQLGGGFHRYTVDGAWRIPHYEKMLYDQAQLIFAWTEAQQLGGVFEAGEAEGIVAETIDFCLRELKLAGGGFAAALDADSPPAPGATPSEGAFYLWSAAELVDLLGPADALLIARIYGCANNGNAPPGTDPHGELRGLNTLYLPEALEDALAEAAIAFGQPKDQLELRLETARAALLARRETRPRPGRDEKLVAAWNGLMTQALARAGRAFQRPEWIDFARETAAATLQVLWPQQLELKRSAMGAVVSPAPAQAADYAAWVAALIELAEATLEPEFWQQAAALQRQFDAALWEEERGLYLSVDPRRVEVPVWALTEDEDGAEPAPNSLSAANLQRLAAWAEQAEEIDRPNAQTWFAQARQILEASANLLRRGAMAQPLRLVALADWLDEVGSFHWRGQDDSARVEAQARLEPGWVWLPNAPSTSAENHPGPRLSETSPAPPAILRCRAGECRWQ